MKTRLVTGGAGFIGSNYVLACRRAGAARVVNLDNLTYAGCPANLDSLQGEPDHLFVRGDIGDLELVSELLRRERPEAVINFAAESHVDRSILGPGLFVETNVLGVCRLLEACLDYWRSLPEEEARQFRFLQVSTDEVYGSLGPDDPAFTEDTPYDPRSPYAASKAAADHLVNSYHHTFGLPILITNCSNNYGPRQFPEKLIPLMVLNAAEEKPLPVYGDGLNVRDWLHVDDHVRALETVLEQGRPGRTYNIGGGCEKRNIDLVGQICLIMDELRPSSSGKPHADLIAFVKDRPGHDRRYAVDYSRLERELGWRPAETLESGLRKTVEWYLENQPWVEAVRSGDYRDWLELNYEKR